MSRRHRQRRSCQAQRSRPSPGARATPGDQAVAHQERCEGEARLVVPERDAHDGVDPPVHREGTDGPQPPESGIQEHERCAELDQERAGPDGRGHRQVGEEHERQGRRPIGDQLLAQPVEGDLVAETLAKRPAPAQRPRDLRDTRQEIGECRHGAHQHDRVAILPASSWRLTRPLTRPLTRRRSRPAPEQTTHHCAKRPSSRGVQRERIG
jgi:hypothetical protein